MTYDGRNLLTEDNLSWKKTFDGLQPSMEDVFIWETIFDGRQLSVQHDLLRTEMLNLRLPKLEFGTKDQVFSLLLFRSPLPPVCGVAGLYKGW